MNVSVKDFECVGFIGFYESLFDANYNLCNLLSEEEAYTFNIPRNSLVEDEDYKFDYDNYKKSIAVGWVETLNSHIRRELGIDCEMEFTDISSPRYYNYSTDRVFCNFKCKNFKWVVNHKILPLMRKHKEILSKIIHDNHTSYDGFCSFMSNDFDEWYTYLAKSSNYKDSQFFLYFSYIVTYLTAISLYGHKEDCLREFNDKVIEEVYEDYESIYENLEYLLTEDELVAKYGETA